MSKPAVLMGITFNDILRSGRGDVIVSILTDAKACY